MGRRLVARGLAFVAVTAAVVLAAEPALAQPTDNEAWDGGFDQKAERRSDFVFGLSTGLVLGSASGYPNELAKIDDPAYEARTGLALGPGGAAWIGGALTDWFTFGIGGMLLNGEGSQGKASGGAFIFRVEAFPLYAYGGSLRDLAFFATFGAGGFEIEGEAGKKGEGGVVSVAGVGSAFELFRFGAFAFAPTAEYVLLGSQTTTAHQSILGARMVIYGGPG